MLDLEIDSRLRIAAFERSERELAEEALAALYRERANPPVLLGNTERAARINRRIAVTEQRLAAMKVA